ncbi:MAG: glucose-6-phosphate isomerase [Candidatus Hydromicrobium sp.]
MGDKRSIKPFTFDIDLENCKIIDADNHIERNLSDMEGQYVDKDSYKDMIEKDDTLLYEVYEKLVTEKPGELIQGLSIVHPGKVGKEYFMTKGHFHSILETSELYLCLKGKGMMIMENPEGDWAVEELIPHKALYVPGRWAHRSVNISDTDFVTLFVYPANAGHDYATIKERGFRKIVIEENGIPTIKDNPKWN